MISAGEYQDLPVEQPQGVSYCSYILYRQCWPSTVQISISTLGDGQSWWRGNARQLALFWNKRNQMENIFWLAASSQSVAAAVGSILTGVDVAVRTQQPMKGNHPSKSCDRIFNQAS